MLRAGYSRVTHPFATLTNKAKAPSDPVRLACVKHAASVRPEPGSNSPNKTKNCLENKTNQKQSVPQQNKKTKDENKQTKNKRKNNKKYTIKFSNNTHTTKPNPTPKHSAKPGPEGTYTQTNKLKRNEY